MSPMAIRNKLCHAILSLRCEKNAPVWTEPGAYFALKLLTDKQATFYCNSSHRSRRCTRCAEIVAINGIQER
jgi:hypothetical protein